MRQMTDEQAYILRLARSGQIDRYKPKLWNDLMNVVAYLLIGGFCGFVWGFITGRTLF